MSSLHNDLDMWANKARVRGLDRIEILNSTAHEIAETLREVEQKDAEIEHLKLEMDGVDNAKEEIGRLLGLTEEFRWKRISAAIHEQKRLIRELMDGRHRDLDKMREMKALIRELVAALDQVKDRARLPGTATRDEINALLAKAKAAGFDP